MKNENNIIDAYSKEQHTFMIFMNSVVDTFKLEPSLNKYGNPVIHTIKSRLKDKEHLRDKLARKYNKDNPITIDNFFDRVTDLAGVRVLHLYQDQFTNIHQLIEKKINSGDWYYKEPPIAYTWDPEYKDFFSNLGLQYKVKDSYYTSIHYLVKPKKDSLITCEIQVRTLFEEIWGEIDHTINYPHPTSSLPCKEQLRVLSKLVSTGTRLADSIFRTNNENNINKNTSDID